MMKVSRALWIPIVLVTIVLLASDSAPLFARPPYLMLFQSDPMRKATVDGCGTCHVNPQGGGARNEFGLAFAGNNRTITPMLRASYPDRFDVATVDAPGGGKFYFADPAGAAVVYEKDAKKVVVDLAAALAAPTTPAAPAAGAAAARPAAPAAAAAAADTTPRHPIANFSFFITSVGPGKGGNLGGIAGADRHCQALATAVNAGHKTWRAYLSTSYDGKAAINAGDRIGAGPWYNSKGLIVAIGPADLHSPNSRLGVERSLTEKGETPARHDILTGTNPDGTAAIDKNCDNWTSSSTGVALLGHFDRQGGGTNPTSWSAAHDSRSCSQEDLRATGGDGLFYCFAINNGQ
jgi:hypothetical protein